MKKRVISVILCILCIIAVDKCVYAENKDEDKKVLQEGYYIIKSVLNTNKVLDIKDASKNNEANLQLSSCNYGTNQIFELIYDEKKQNYQIKSVFSGKVLDLANAGKNNCTNVQQNKASNVDWQKWELEKTKDGYYSLKSIWNGLYLDVHGNNTKDGTNIEVYRGNNGKNQKFIFEKINIPKNNANVGTGFYQIVSASDNKKVFDVLEEKKSDKALVGIYRNKSGANQKFKIEKNSNGYYSIINLNSSLYLEAYGKDIKQCKKDKNANSQDWIFVDCKDGYYNIVSRCGGMYITVDGSQGLKISKKNGSNSQKFKLSLKSNLSAKQTIQDGYYIIKSSIDKNKVVDIEGASTKAGTNAILWQRNSRNNQKFKFTYDGNGYYKITSVKSKKVLDVEKAGISNGSNIQQNNDNGVNWQKWVVQKNQDGTYSIISAHNGLYMDLPYGKTANGTNVELYTGNGGKNQKFILEKTDGVEGTKTISDGYYKLQTNQNKVLEIANFSKKNHEKLTIATSNNGYNQNFKVTYKENGFYTITAVHSGKVLDLGSDGITLEQDSSQDLEEQEWAIKKTYNGSYYIVSAHNGLCINATNENKINLTKNNNSNNQYFKFKSVSVEKGGKTISNGTYQVITGLDNKKVLDIEAESNKSGANLEIWTNKKGNNQKFKLQYQENGYYKIIALNSGKALAVEKIGTGNTVDVKQYSLSDSSKQDWIIKSCGNGYYNIISACNGLYLNVAGSKAVSGANVEVSTKQNSTAQKFKFEVPFKLEVTSGTYGSSGLKVKGDSRGQSLKYYKIGNGPNVYFATFAVHGWEDLYKNDGKALTKIAEEFKNKLIEMQDENLSNKWTIYIFPAVNPDGENYGWTHNGPGRTSLYSSASSHKGIDINRCWSTGYTKYTGDRNYNGTSPFQSYEARALRDFLLAKRSTKGQTILVDLHGWLNETIGDNGVGSYYRSQYGISKHIDTYGRGYLVNWARSNLGYNGRTARSALVELPEWNSDSSKYTNATINMLRNII